MINKAYDFFHTRKVVYFLNAAVCALIPIIFCVALVFALSSCSTSVTVQNPIEVPEIPEGEIDKFVSYYIDEPVTEMDLMQNIYVLEGLLYTYMDYTDTLIEYISQISSASFEG